MSLKPGDFWNLTYAELVAMVEGRKRKNIRKNNELIYLAWHIEAFARQKKLPALDSLLQEESKNKKQQTDEEMMGMAKILNAAFGGEVIEVYDDL